jgi:hypothetical protein
VEYNTEAQLRPRPEGLIARERLTGLVLAAVRAGFTLDHIGEHAADAEFAARYPRARKYVGWPMLVVLGLRA